MEIFLVVYETLLVNHEKFLVFYEIFLSSTNYF